MEGRLLTSFLVLFVLILSYTAAEEKESSIRVVGRLGADPVSVVFAPPGGDVELICDLGEVSNSFKERNTSKWSFTSENSQFAALQDVAAHCEEESAVNHLKALNTTISVSDCEVSVERNDEDNHLHFVLELDNIDDRHFGEYVCHSGNALKINHTFILQEIVTITRRTDKGKIQRQSLTVIEGETLYLYCNATGLNDLHEISWWRDGVNITTDLYEHLGLFENFTKTDDLTHHGDSVMDHRANYTCRVDLKNQTNEAELPGLRKHFPVEYSVYVRVQEPGRWQLPLYVLLGEAALIALFTIIINIRESRYGEGEADGDYEDSDDEDETQASKNGGMTNNNSSSS